jgi:ribulose-5-phosphate 4-epimerase/fuculose-1-phosphate aldolase
MTDEGVIKYHLDFRVGAPPPISTLAALIAWQRICHGLVLVGQVAERYAGYAYGNLSQRTGARAFLVSGTQTAGRALPTADDYTRVTGWSIAENRLTAEGPCKPSSESLTHAALYEHAPDVGFIIHAHSPEIWHAAGRLGLPVTDPAVAYGTPAMAEAVWRLFATGLSTESGVFAMGGHEDGVVAYGRDAAAAGQLMVATLAAAFQT